MLNVLIKPFGDEYLTCYTIYVRENNGAWVTHDNVTPATLTYEAKYSDLNAKRKFGIRTVSLGGALSALVEF